MTPQILIVEDEQLLLRTLTRTLRRATTFEVAGVESVAATRETLEHFRPHLVICDLELGDGSGLEVLDLLRRHGLAVPVIVVSGYVGKYESSIPQQRGIIVRQKPLPARELLDIVEVTLAPLDGDVPAPGGLGVTDYLQMAQYGRRSLRIEVRGAGTAGSITMWQGDVWRAGFGKLRGVDAIAAMLSANAVVTRTRGVEEMTAEREIDVPTHALLIDIARAQDEAQRDGTESSVRTPEAVAEIGTHLASVADLVARDQLPDAAAQLAHARDGARNDVRLNAWWCEALVKRWHTSHISNGGAA